MNEEQQAEFDAVVNERMSAPVHTLFPWLQEFIERVSEESFRSGQLNQLESQS